MMFRSSYAISSTMRQSLVMSNDVFRRSVGQSTKRATGLAMRFKSAVVPATSSSALPQDVVDTMTLFERIPKRRPTIPTALSRLSPAGKPGTLPDEDKNVLVMKLKTQAMSESLEEETQEEEEEERTRVTYTDDMVLSLTSRLHLHVPKEGSSAPNPWPVYRLMEETGRLRNEEDQVGVQECVAVALRENELLKNEHFLLTKAYRTMIRLRQMDDIMISIQRQGRVSFYMSAKGEEAIHMGVASALASDDVVLAQYREQGVLLWRGFTLEQMAHQCFGTNQDLGKGRQMPVHYGSRALHFHTVSSPLGTQLPQAVGVAYKLKLDNKKNNDGSADQDQHRRCAVTFFGEGAASTGDFHTACNMAATLETPLLLICRNNGYAISTSTREQYRGDGIISRAPGYGIAAIRVDGNDLLAVHSAIQRARAYAVVNNAPVMVECMTYRQTHHSTSDDSARYRSKDEVHSWTTDDGVDPINRLLNFMILQKQEQNDALSSQQAEKIVMEEYAHLCQEERKKVLQALDKAEHCPKPGLDTMFEDVYKEKPPSLIRQEQELMEHVNRHPELYGHGRAA
jgi:2-oxoisovalerate dehydrogenase E1 component alpha subunit